MWQRCNLRARTGFADGLCSCSPLVAVGSTHEPLARHAQNRFLVGQGAEPHCWDPREGMRFFADPESVVLGLNEEAYIEVEVGRLAATGRNPVHVDVEHGVVERPHLESGLLARFPQRDREGIGISVAVPTGLQPAPEFAMVRQEHAVARHVHDPRRARDVADPAGTVETVGVRVDEGIEACDGRRLLRPSPAVCGEECFQCAAVHSTKRRGAVLALMRIIDHTGSVHIPERPHEGNSRVPERNRVIDPSP